MVPRMPTSIELFWNLENHRNFYGDAAERATLGDALKAKKKPKEKARSRQPAALQPDLNEATGYGRLMSFNNLGFLLPQPSFANPW